MLVSIHSKITISATPSKNDLQKMIVLSHYGRLVIRNERAKLNTQTQQNVHSIGFSIVLE